MRVGRSPGWRASFGASGLALLAAVCIAACGGSSGAASTPSTTTGPAKLSGKQIFESAGCAGCHTLAAAGATGSVGPDLDKLRPTVAAVEHQVIHGGGVMPSFAHSLSRAQITALARFVSNATR